MQYIGNNCYYISTFNFICFIAKKSSFSKSFVYFPNQLFLALPAFLPGCAKLQLAFPHFYITRLAWELEVMDSVWWIVCRVFVSQMVYGVSATATTQQEQELRNKNMNIILTATITTYQVIYKIKKQLWL